jgi:DNA-binding response OmpR family regulator
MKVEGMGKIKVLIAEDIEATIKLYNKALSDDFFEKKVAMNGQEALDQYEKWRPDIILLDMLMPLVSGYTVLKTIRKDHKDVSTTIIIATSQGDIDDVKSSATYGIQGYIVKPFKFKELEDKVLECYSKNHPETANAIMKNKAECR